MSAPHTGGEATAARLQDVALGGRSVMIPGAFHLSARVPIDRVTPPSGHGANWSRAADAISGVDRAEYELEGGGALCERQHPAHREEAGNGAYTTGDRIKAWGRIGVVWGALWGAHFGPEFFVMPGIRTVFGVGPVASWIVGALEGALVLGSVTALVAGLLSLWVFNRTAVEEHDTSIARERGGDRDR